MHHDCPPQTYSHSSLIGTVYCRGELDVLIFRTFVNFLDYYMVRQSNRAAAVKTWTCYSKMDRVSQSACALRQIISGFQIYG